MDQAERIGRWLSGIGHVGLITWAIVGGALFRPQPTAPVQMTQVATMSEAEFQSYAAASRGAGPVSGEAANVGTLPQPETEEVQPGTLETASAPNPETEAQPLPLPSDRQDAPDLTDLTAPQQPVTVATELPDIAQPTPEEGATELAAAQPPASRSTETPPQQPEAPETPAAPAENAQPPAPELSPLALDSAARPLARPNGLVEDRNRRLAAAEAARQAAEAERIRQAAQAAAETQARAQAEREAEEAQAQARARAEAEAARAAEEAARQQAEQAQREEERLAAEQAERDRLAAEEEQRLQREAEEQAERDAEAAAEVAQQRTEEAAPAQDALAAALAEARGQPSPDGGGATDGPPLSQSERDGFRIAIEQCWNIGALSREAAGTTVSVAFSMSADGMPEPGTMRLMGHSGGSPAAAQQAYEAARRAVLRCAGNGYDLPADKYNRWKEVIIDFRPEGVGLQ